MATTHFPLGRCPPEIIQCLGDVMPPKQLVAFARVSKAFATLLTPILYDEGFAAASAHIFPPGFFEYPDGPCTTEQYHRYLAMEQKYKHSSERPAENPWKNTKVFASSYILNYLTSKTSAWFEDQHATLQRSGAAGDSPNFLHVCISNGVANPAVINILIHKCADINAVNGKRESALGLAIRAWPPHESATVIKLLLADGADILASQIHGHVPLLQHVIRRHDQPPHIIPDSTVLTVVKAWVAAGGNMMAADPFVQSALHCAVVRGDLTIVKAVAAAGGPFLNKQDQEGMTALHYAVLKDELDMVKVILDTAANVNVQASNGFTALARAVVKAFKKTDDKAEDIKKDVDKGEASLKDHEPVYNHTAFSIAQTLIAAGASLETKDRDGMTALSLAVLGDNVDMVRELVTAGANLEIKNKDGKPALFLAVVGGNVDMIRALVEAGADVNTTGPDGTTLLAMTLKTLDITLNVALIQLLIDAGATLYKA